MKNIYFNKLKQKEKVIIELKEQYRVFKSEWNNYTGYDRWINQPINNAQLNTISTYYDHVPAFVNLLKINKMDLKKFYAACIELSKLDKEQRCLKLTELGEGEPSSSNQMEGDDAILTHVHFPP